MVVGFIYLVAAMNLMTRPEFNRVRRNSGFTARSGVYADRSYAAIQPPLGDTINAS